MTNSEVIRIAFTALVAVPILMVVGLIETMMSDSGFFFGLAGIALIVSLGSGLIILIRIVFSMWGVA